MPEGVGSRAYPSSSHEGSQMSFQPETILVTGGCGFIGSNFIKELLKTQPELRIINLDSLTYAGNLANLADCLSNPRHIFVKGSICDSELVNGTIAEHRPQALLNFAAESHVDRSIDSPMEFFDTNVGGTLALLNAAREHGVDRFLQVSTDEVYGSLGDTGLFTEETPLAPNSPYSASKTAADMFVRAYHHTFGMDTIITRCSNNYGPYQFPEKLIPLIINNARHERPLPVYGTGLNVRDWIHVRDHCLGIWTALTKGQAGEVYNFGGNSERTNLQVIKTILNILDKPESLIEFVKDRPGHDQRYAIDASKAKRELGWEPSKDFESGLKGTVCWYLENAEWLDSVTSGQYRDYYRRHYGKS